MITLKINMVTTGDLYSLNLTVWCMKLKSKMLAKILVTDNEMFDFSNYLDK